MDESTFLRALQRARAEFLEMPGLALTLAQASRLWAIDVDTCATILSRLVETGFLVATRHATFIRA